MPSDSVAGRSPQAPGAAPWLPPLLMTLMALVAAGPWAWVLIFVGEGAGWVLLGTLPFLAAAVGASTRTRHGALGVWYAAVSWAFVAAVACWIVGGVAFLVLLMAWEGGM